MAAKSYWRHVARLAGRAKPVGIVAYPKARHAVKGLGALATDDQLSMSAEYVIETCDQLYGS